MAETKLKSPSDITPELREKLEERWGEEWTDKDYIVLERTYRNLCKENQDVASDTAMYLRDLAACLRRKEVAIASNDTKMVNTLLTNIKQDLAMIKDARDQKTIEKTSVDGLVRALEERGLMEDGVMLLDGVIDYIRTDHGTYHMSKDAVDAMMLAIVNAMRFNNGVSEIAELPEDMRIQDLLGEFVDEPGSGERETLVDLGIVPRRPGGK